MEVYNVHAPAVSVDVIYGSISRASWIPDVQYRYLSSLCNESVTCWRPGTGGLKPHIQPVCPGVVLVNCNLNTIPIDEVMEGQTIALACGYIEIDERQHGKCMYITVNHPLFAAF